MPSDSCCIYSTSEQKKKKKKKRRERDELGDGSDEFMCFLTVVISRRCNIHYGIHCGQIERGVSEVLIESADGV